jgi:hypothetical protein
MNEINKDELLDIKKWQRFFFMAVYGLAIYFIVYPLLFFAFAQFLFYLFTSSTNTQLQSANDWLHGFFNDALNFLSFNTNAKPWPFSGAEIETESTSSKEVIDGETGEVELSADKSE